MMLTQLQSSESRQEANTDAGGILDFHMRYNQYSGEHAGFYTVSILLKQGPCPSVQTIPLMVCLRGVWGTI